MIEQISLIAIIDGILLLFFAFGYYAGHTQPTPVKGEQTNSKPIATPSVKSGIIDYPSQSDIDYTQSGEEKVDNERERVFREQFKV